MSYKNKKMGLAVIGMTSLLSVSGFSYAAGSSDLNGMSVNEYDCSPTELREYVAKKTDYFVNAQSSMSTWEEFKRQEVLDGAAANAPKSGKDSQGNDNEQCNYFWGDLEDWDTGMGGDSGSGEYDEYVDIFLGLISGDLSGIWGAVKSEMAKQAQAIYEQAKKGVCQRLSSSNVKREVYRAADKYLDRRGYDYGDVLGKDSNDFIEDVLVGAYGSNGRLLNILDPSLDRRREGYINREIDRQIKVLDVN